MKAYKKFCMPLVVCFLLQITLVRFVSAAGDIVAGSPIFKKVVNEIEEVVTSPEIGFIKTEINVSNNSETAAGAALIVALFDDINDTLVSANIDSQQIPADTNVILSAGLNIESLDGYSYKYFLWNSLEDMKPYELPPLSPSGLYASTSTIRNITAQWNKSKNAEGYIISKDGAEIGRTANTYFTDYNLDYDTAYNYTVAAYDSKGNISNGTALTAKTAVAPHCILAGSNIQENGLEYYYNEDMSSDAYSLPDVKNGIECRKTFSYTRPPETNDPKVRTGCFYFRASTDYITSEDTNLTFEITYFDEGTGGINVQYNAADGSCAKSAFVAVRTNTNEWKTATVSIADAKFVRHKDIQYSDFRILGNGTTHVSQVAVVKSENYVAKNSTKKYQEVSASLAQACTSNGLTLVLKDDNDATDARTTADNIGGRDCRVTRRLVGETNRLRMFYFQVDDEYMYGPACCNATITFDYYDEGTGNVGIEYYSTAGYKATDTMVKKMFLSKTNTCTWKTAEVSINNAVFINQINKGWTSADFRIWSEDAELCISDIKVARVLTNQTIPNEKLTVFLAGDSTCENVPSAEYPRTGWGTKFAEYFTDDVIVENYAKAGLSTKTYLNSTRLDEILPKAKKGDYLFIQLGHNDSMTGQEKATEANSDAQDRTSYKYNLTEFVTRAREKEMIPVFLTPIRLCLFENGIIKNDGIDVYRNEMISLGNALNVPVIDVGSAHREYLDICKEEFAKQLFLFSGITSDYTGETNDTTHPSVMGANEIAKIVINKINGGTDIRVLRQYIDRTKNTALIIPSN